MTLHLSATTNKIFRPTVPSDSQNKEAILVKKLRQGYASWSTNKVILGWKIDNRKNVLTLTHHRVITVAEALYFIPLWDKALAPHPWGPAQHYTCSNLRTGYVHLHSTCPHLRIRKITPPICLCTWLASNLEDPTIKHRRPTKTPLRTGTTPTYFVKSHGHFWYQYGWHMPLSLREMVSMEINIPRDYARLTCLIW